MTVNDAYNKILPLLEYYIVADLFSASGLQEQAFGNDSLIRTQAEEIVNSMPYNLDETEKAQLINMLTAEGKNYFTMYENNRSALTKRKEEFDIILPTLVEEQPEIWRDVLDQSRMTDAEREYEEFIQGQAALQDLYGSEELAAAVGSMLGSQFYGIQGSPAIGQRGFGTGGTLPIFTLGIETNLYADPHIQKNGQTWLQDIQLRLVELGLLGDYINQEDRTIYTPNQLDQPTINAMQDLMTTLNRSGQYLPSGDELIKGFVSAGIDTANIEAALASGDAAAVSRLFADVASSPKTKGLFHNYLLQGADSLIKDKRKTGMDTQIIVTPSMDARMSEAKNQWLQMTGSLMNPYLAGVAAADIAKIYEEVQLSEGRYMSPYTAAASVYKSAQQDRIKGDAPNQVVKPFSDPLELINQKVTESIAKLVIEDNQAMNQGALQQSYGTNLWRLLSSLG